MRRTSMPRGSSFPFHPTTIAPFSLLFDTACTNTLGRLNLVNVRWIGLDRALCLGHRRAVLFFILLTFSDRILCTISARRYNPRRRHSVSSPYSPNP